MIVKDGKVVSKGFHKRFGGRHAEQVAIDNLPQNITKTTMYVTLEPCAHKGKTNPCIDLIDPSIFNSDDKEVVEDLIVAAIKDAQEKASEKAKEEMGKLTEGLGLPPGMKLPF